MPRKFNLIFIILVFVFSLNFALAEIGSTQVEFSTSGWSCNEDSLSAEWRDYQGENVYDSEPVYENGQMVEGGDCFAHMSEADRTCCPGNLVCIEEVGEDGEITGRGVCSGTADYCFQLTGFGKKSCKGASDSIGENSVELINENVACGYSEETSNGCYDLTTCGCEWSGDECAAAYTEEKNIGVCGVGPSLESCYLTVIETIDECDTKDIITLIHNGTCTTDTCDPSCGVARPTEYSCATTIKLPFFSWFNFVLAGLSIVGIYYFTRRD